MLGRWSAEKLRLFISKFLSLDLNEIWPRLVLKVTFESGHKKKLTLKIHPRGSASCCVYTRAAWTHATILTSLWHKLML